MPPLTDYPIESSPPAGIARTDFLGDIQKTIDWGPTANSFDNVQSVAGGLQEKMDARVAQLRRCVDQAMVAVLGGDSVVQKWSGMLLTNIVGNQNIRQDNQNFLNNVSGYIDLLEGHESDVQSGDWTYDKWENLSKTYYAQIATIAPEIDAWSGSGIFANTVSATTNTIKATAQAVGQGSLPALIAVAAILMLLLILFH